MMAYTNTIETAELDENYLAPDSAQHKISNIFEKNSMSAVSWSAIFAGATAAAALALILLLLGTGLGLSTVSPWSTSGIAATTFGLSAILWLTFTQVVAYGMGGYLAGRLRTRWLAVHSDEVYFRDTVHGFLTWAVASLATAALLTSVIGSIIGSGMQAAPLLASGISNVASINAPLISTPLDNIQNTETINTGNAVGSMSYFVSALFRKKMDTLTAVGPDEIRNLSNDATSEVNVSAEIATIFMNTIRRGELPANDVQYVGQLIVERTGLSQLEAEKRVMDTYANVQTKLRNAQITAKDTANTARKASAYAALWLFISLLMGAFVASWAATCGGRNRDA